MFVMFVIALQIFKEVVEVSQGTLQNGPQSSIVHH
jgi:hypothetical protein